MLALSAVLFWLVLLTLFPPFAYVALGQSSMAVGVGVVAAGIFFFYVRLFPRLHFGYTGLVFGLLFLIQSFLALSLGEVGDFDKVLLSYFLLVLVFISSGVFSKVIQAIASHDLVVVAGAMTALGLSLGILSLFYKVGFLGYSAYPKAIFPFSEPSHYAIAFSGYFVFSSVCCDKKYGLLIIFLLAALGALLPSVSLLVICCVAVLLRFSSPVTAVFGIVFLFVFVSIFSQFVDVSYFSDRLVLDGDAENLSGLVYMQGWEEAWRALVDTNGMGVGFQNSTSMSYGDAAEKIYSILGSYKNREDLGFLMAKMTVELGLLGLVLVFSYFYFFAKAFRALVRYVQSDSSNRFGAAYFFACSVIVGFCVEMFVRGVGYFTPGLFLLLMSISILRK